MSKRVRVDACGIVGNFIRIETLSSVKTLWRGLYRSLVTLFSEFLYENYFFLKTFSNFDEDELHENLKFFWFFPVFYFSFTLHSIPCHMLCSIISNKDYFSKLPQHSSATISHNQSLAWNFYTFLSSGYLPKNKSYLPGKSSKFLLAGFTEKSIHNSPYFNPLTRLLPLKWIHIFQMTNCFPFPFSPFYIFSVGLITVSRFTANAFLFISWSWEITLECRCMWKVSSILHFRAKNWH